ncbi:MAG: hypothetical protein AAGA35_01600 [Patescibacteria group bacterium]
MKLSVFWCIWIGITLMVLGMTPFIIPFENMVLLQYAIGIILFVCGFPFMLVAMLSTDGIFAKHEVPGVPSFAEFPPALRELASNGHLRILLAIPGYEAFLFASQTESYGLLGLLAFIVAAYCAVATSQGISHISVSLYHFTISSCRKRPTT